MQNKPRFLVIHCSDVSYHNLRDQFSSINTYHRDVRQFPVSSLGLYVGYQILLTGGKSYRCRLDTDEGAHTNQVVDGVSMNYQSLGICIGFDGDIEMPPQPELDLLIAQIRAWMAQYSIPLQNVRLHREYATYKTCPGTLITKDWLYQLIQPPAPLKPADQVEKQQQIIMSTTPPAWWQTLFRLLALFAKK